MLTSSQSSLNSFFNSLRKEERVLAALPVKVFFGENDRNSSCACTYEISRNGARISHVPGIKEAQQCLWLQRSIRKARYRVVWIGESGTERQQQVGLELLDMDIFLWDECFRNKLI